MTEELRDKMTNTYWIDKKGGSHYHKETCSHIKDNPQYHYEPITRSLPRIHSLDGWGLTRVREGGKYYMACPACFYKRRGEK